MLGFITRRDYRVMQRANNWLAPKWVRRWTMAATRAGDGWIWALMGLAILFLGDEDRFAVVGAGVLAAVLSVVIFMFLKRVTGRRRPCEIEAHCWATLLPPDRFSFPSGHTMTAFAVTIATCMFYPVLALGMFLCALSIATSRVLLGMHFVSDVLAGALIGGVIGYASYLAFA